MKRITFIALSLLAGLALLSSCKKDEAPVYPEGNIIAPEGQHATFYSSVLSYEVTSNCDWTITLDEDSPLTIDPLKGTEGTTTVSVTLPDNKTQDVLKSSFSIVFKNSADESFSYVVEIEQPRPSVEIGGLSYKVAYLADGQYWMTENLRYVPEGKTVSKDLAAIDNGVWYPLMTDDDHNMLFDETAEGVMEKGYLYTAEVAYGSAVTPDNYKTFAKVQGICPEGWHIPDFYDWFGLIGRCSQSKPNKDNPDAPYWEDNADAPYYDAAKKFGSIDKAAADGMPIPITGYVNVSNMTETAGTMVTGVKDGVKAMVFGYILSSSAYQLVKNKTDGTVTNISLYALMPNANNGTLNVGNLNYRSGVSVRCVKNSAAPADD